MGRVFKMSAAATIMLTLGIVCLFFPAVSANGAKDGLMLCANIIIPSLFPFCAIALFGFKSGIFNKASKLFAPISMRIFRLSGEKFCVFLMSMIAGYPVGARLVRTLYEQDEISKAEAKRMILYCVSAGPAFILTAIGEGILGDSYYGLALLIGNITATLILAFIIEFRTPQKPPSHKQNHMALSDAFVEATADASRSIMGICGWVILFSAIIAIVNFLPIPQNLKRFFLLISEVTNGTLCADKNVVLIAVLLSFCGLCIHSQIYSAAKEIAPRYPKFLIFRAFHAAISALITYLFLILDNRTVKTITNNVVAKRNNVSFSYASAAALIFLGLMLCASISEHKKIKFM